MKSAIPVMFFVLLWACSEKNKEQTNNLSIDSLHSIETKTTSIDVVNWVDTLIPFTGYWISEDYYNSIQKFKSPKKAQFGSEFIFIPARTLKPTMMIYNFHEGGPYMTILKTDRNYQVWLMENDSITFKRNDIEIISESKIKFDDKTFIRINPEVTNDEELILENILFEGLYKTNHGGKVEFKKNGEITGLENITYYTPIIDYFDAGLEVDQVGLGASQKNIEWFGFKFTNDTLELYKLNCNRYDSTNKICGEVSLGDIVYKLKKIE